MTRATAGINAFDDRTQAQLKALRANPIAKNGTPIFCKSCTDKMGYGHPELCPRRGTQTAGQCPFRES